MLRRNKNCSPLRYRPPKICAAALQSSVNPEVRSPRRTIASLFHRGSRQVDRVTAFHSVLHLVPIFHEGDMTTIRQLLQNGPAKANGLFAKLVDTSDGAIETRKRLFADLRTELDLLARLEEEHLFPAL